jgi:hypothetical protein
MFALQRYVVQCYFNHFIVRVYNSHFHFARF